MKISIPEFSVVALIGTSGSGKSSFARKHFLSTEVVSSDECRALVSDDENDQAATGDAFALLNMITSKRLSRKRLTVIDATNVQSESRKPILKIAHEFHSVAVAIVLNLPESVCAERNREHPGRQFGPHVLKHQAQQLRKSIRNLKSEGFRYIYVLDSIEEIDSVEIVRERLWTNKEDEKGPFDIIGDVHGCYEELCLLLERLDYRIDVSKIRSAESAVIAPEGRRAIFVGDLVDRGPASPEVLALVMNMVKHGTAFCVPGNHDAKLLKFLNRRQVTISHGLELTIAQFENESHEFKQDVREFLGKIVSHLVLDDGKLVVAHAGMREDYQGRASRRVREFALYGETTGEVDEFGLPIRHNWANEYRGKAVVVYGHTPTPTPEWLNNTICIDTGCVFGGTLTALRYPERELVSVPAAKVYYEPIRPLLQTLPTLSAQQLGDDLLDINDVVGKRIINTRLRPNITIREENAAAALEIMSRFAVNPKWLVYLPPTMSPSETSRREDYLEHPEDALAYFQKNGVQQVICEEKHMGSRAIFVICRNQETALKRFGVSDEGLGVCYSRSGRSFFENKETEQRVLQRIILSLETAEFWEQNKTDWVVLDAEIMPWSLKATELIKNQYAPVGAAGISSLSAVSDLLSTITTKSDDLIALEAEVRERLSLLRAFRDSYRHYCWPFQSIDDIKVAPFHILATEGHVHFDQPHRWHMETIATFCKFDPGFLTATRTRIVDLNSDESCAEALEWWQELTNNGGEGMVVKPMEFTASGNQGVLQPAIKCRGREYLRIIYGAEYTLPEQMNRLRARGLSKKRSMASREFALGFEGLERFVRREALRSVHECVFGVLALETEVVDPRL